MSEGNTSAANMPSAGRFDPGEILRLLNVHGVRYVLIGGVAARLHGSPALTEDLDLTPEQSPTNLGKLAAALSALGARLAVPGVDEGLAVPLDENTFSSPVMTFLTRAGATDIVREIAAVGGYEPLAKNAVMFEAAGVRFAVAALDDIIASKEAAGRAKDRAQLPVLHALRSELRARTPDQRD